MKSCFGLFMLAFIACNDPSPVPFPEQTSAEADTPISTVKSVEEEIDAPTSFVPGYYTGLLPCEDCKNIKRKILFLKDHRFHMMDEYLGKETVPVEKDGLWQTTNDQVQLLVNNTVTIRFAVTNKGLIEVSTTGTPIAQGAGGYLTRTIIGADNKAWMEKKASGIDFLALGTEPFWMMEIDKDKQLSFLQVEKEKTIIFPYAAAALQNGQWVYNVKTDSAKMQVVITPQFCSDGMSDNWYEYKVEANYNGTVYAGCGVKLNALPE